MKFYFNLHSCDDCVLAYRPTNNPLINKFSEFVHDSEKRRGSFNVPRIYMRSNALLVTWLLVLASVPILSGPSPFSLATKPSGESIFDRIIVEPYAHMDFQPSRVKGLTCTWITWIISLSASIVVVQWLLFHATPKHLGANAIVVHHNGTHALTKHTLQSDFEKERDLFQSKFSNLEPHYESVSSQQQNDLFAWDHSSSLLVDRLLIYL